MKSLRSLPVVVLSIVLLATMSSFLDGPIVIDIQKEVRKNNTNIINREVTNIIEEGYHGIRLNEAYEDGIVWLKNMEFRNGVIEFDVRGKDFRSHSFVGVAFHGTDTSTYESIYLRPFHFNATEEPMKSRAIQYVSKPDYSWQVLRADYPGKFEGSITPSPDPNSWVHMKVVVADATISTYINGSSSPCMVVDKMGKSSVGSVGFFVADTSGGDFANLKITKAD